MANNLSAFTPIKYSMKLLELLYNDTLYPSITNTDYEGTFKQAGDTVRVRVGAKITLSDYSKGMTLVTQDLTPTSEDMLIDMMKYFKFEVDDVDKIQNDINAIEAYASETKNIISETIDTDVLGYMAKNVNAANMIGTDYSTGTVAVAATTGVVTGTGTTFTAAMVGGIFTATGLTGSFYVSAYTSATSITITDLGASTYSGGALTAGAAYSIAGATAISLTSSNVYEELVALRTALSKSLSPKASRFIVVNADFEGILLQSPAFTPAVANAYNDVVINGLIGKIAGFEVYSSELIPGDNTNGYFFIAGNKKFCSFATQINKVNILPSEMDPNSFMATAKGLVVWGKKVFDATRAHGAVLRGTVA